MKTRILSGLVGAAMCIVILFFYSSDYIVLNLAIGFISFMAVYELLIATKYVKSKLLVITALAFAVFVPFFRNPYFSVPGKTACFLFVALLFVFMLFENGNIRLEQMGLVFLISTVIPFAFSTIIYIRDFFGQTGGVFYIVLIFLISWGTDIGAYFTGTFFGKHKMAPSISPKKTWEGAVGGVIGCVGICALWAFLYGMRWPSVDINYLALIPVALLLSGVSMFGDLAASLIKRTCNIKDFGKIMPGHGGVLDRFDSVLFVAPSVFILLETFPKLIVS